MNHLKKLSKIFLTIAICLICLSSISAQNKANLQKDLNLMMNWFEGRFDNYQQTVEEKDQKAEFPHEHIHSIFHRVNLPKIGENVFYVQQYMDGDASKIYRQRLYSFAVNEKEKAIELQIYSFDDDKKYADAHLDESKLANLTFDKLKSIPGCEVYWRLSVDKFEGTMKPNACRVVSSRSGKNLIITDDLFLTEDEIWINDQAKDDKGNYVFGNKANVHHKLKKVRMFEGWTAIVKTGEAQMALEDFPREDYKGQRDLTIHDGGEIVKVSDKYSIQLAKLKYNPQTEVLTLKIIDNETGKTAAYSWANPDAERIGINLRWIQAGLTLKK